MTSHHRIRTGRLSRTQLGYILVSPALLMIAFVSVYPFLTTLWYSLHTMLYNGDNKRLLKFTDSSNEEQPKFAP